MPLGEYLHPGATLGKKYEKTFARRFAPIISTVPPLLVRFDCIWFGMNFWPLDESSPRFERRTKALIASQYWIL